MSELKFRTQFTKFKKPKVSFGVSLTKQSFKDECDINNIMRRFEKTGTLPELIRSNPQYGDFSNVPDYQDALNIVRHAHEQFENLSSKIRERFSNDPARFLAFANDPSNAQEMVSLGLAVPRQAPTPSQPSSSVRGPSGQPAEQANSTHQGAS